MVLKRSKRRLKGGEAERRDRRRAKVFVELTARRQVGNISTTVIAVEAHREGRNPTRETKSRKKGGAVRQRPKVVTTKRGGYRVSKWVRDGVVRKEGLGTNGRVKALRVDRTVAGIKEKNNAV